MDAPKVGFLLIGVVAGIYAVIGILRGEIYCKGTFSRAAEPVKFWSSVAVYIGWMAMMLTSRSAQALDFHDPIARCV
jgi:hypothetical protein